MKAEVSSIESVEFIADDADDVKYDVKYAILFDPRQRSDTSQASLAALTIRPSSSSSSIVKVCRAVGSQRPKSRPHPSRGVRSGGPTQAKRAPEGFKVSP